MYEFSKDGITISAMLDTRRETGAGDYPVKIRVTYRRDRKYYSTGKRMTKAEWEKLPASKSKRAVELREALHNSFDIVKIAVEDLASNAEFSFDALNARLRKATSGSIGTAIIARVAELKADNRIGTMLYYDNILKGLERFKGHETRIDGITVDWLNRYEKFLLKEDKTYTTIGMHMRGIRAIMNEAKNAGLIKQAQYPFSKGRYEIKTGEGRKMALTIEQIGMIARYDDGREATRKYCDYWLFLYLCNGMNMADFVKLRYRDIVDGEIRFIRQKTERTTKTRKEIRVVITDPAQCIIDTWGNPPHPNSYIFPVLKGDEDAFTTKRKTQYLTRAINRRMADIGNQLGIGNISTYTARHSFATVLKRSGANIAFISESLGHNDLKTTENYLASFEKEERQKNAELLTKF